MSPPVRIRTFLEGARAATGATVVIDVFRAFSLVPWALARGARMVVPVRTEAEALALKEQDPDLIIAGERGGQPLAGFDLGNSPAAVREADLAGRILVHRTSAGTQGLLAAMEAGAAPVVAGSFLTASATAAFLLSSDAAEISLVAMGWDGREDALEDTLCAIYLRALLRGVRLAFEPLRDRIRRDPTGRRFFDPELPWFPEADFDACMDVDRFDSAIVAAQDPVYGVRLQYAPRP